MSFDLRALRASRSQTQVALRYGPRIDDVFPLRDPLEEEEKEALRQALLSAAGTAPGASWRCLLADAWGREVGAKILVVLGRHLGCWTAFPEEENGPLWSSPDAPTILEVNEAEQTARDAEAHGVSIRCASCGAVMGRWDDPKAPLPRAGPEESECLACYSGYR